MSEESRKNISSLYVAIGKNICRFRKELSLTQTQLGSKIGVSQTHLAALERGSRRIPLEDLLQVAQVLGVPLSALLPSEADPQKPIPRPKLVLAYEKLLLLSEKEQNAVVVMIESIFKSHNGE